MFIKNLTKAVSASILFGTSQLFAGSMCDLPYAWDGFYAGAQAGYGWANANWRFINEDAFFIFGSPLLSDRFRVNANGFLGGANLGYNFEYEDWIAGLEFGINGTNMNGRRISPFFPLTDTFKTSMKWYSTLKARLGHAHDDWLLFINGGWAGAQVDLQLQRLILTNTFLRANLKNQWSNGWTFGGGLEYRINESFSLGITYDFIQLLPGRHTMVCPDCVIVIGDLTPVVDGHFNFQVVALRFNYFADQY